MRLLPAAIVLAGLAGCSDPDREWVKSCTTGGLPTSLCECLADNIPAGERKKLLSMPLTSFGGGWVLIPNNAEAAYCEKYIQQWQSEKAR